MIKIKIVGLDLIHYGPSYKTFYHLLTSSPEFEIVENNADLIVIAIYYYRKNMKKYDGKKVLIFSGEDLFYKVSRKSMNILKHLGLANSFVKQCIPSFLLFKPYLSLKTLSKKDTFWIVCNNIKRNNVHNYPFYFDTHLDQLNEFIEIKKQQAYTKKKKFCAFAVFNDTVEDRLNFFHKLSKYKRVDSYGKVLNNAQEPIELLKKYKYPHINDEEITHVTRKGALVDVLKLNQELFREYKFVICFENSYSEDNVTEKLPNAMLGNAIGIYRGAPNVGEFFNTRSFINYDDYGNDEAVIEKIIELDQDDAKYAAMLAEPFLVNNEIPVRAQTAKQDLKRFILKCAS